MEALDATKVKLGKLEQSTNFEERVGNLTTTLTWPLGAGLSQQAPSFFFT